MKKRSLVFIDDNAFRHYLREVSRKDYANFQFIHFCEHLIQKFGDNEEFIRLYFYSALPLKEYGETQQEITKSNELYEERVTFIEKLKKSGRVDVELGSIRLKYDRKHNDVSFEEKGVDVKLSSDIVKFTFIGNYDVFYVVTADNDIAHCLKNAREYGKIIKWVNISTGKNKERKALQEESDYHIMLKPRNINKIFET